MRPVYIKTFGCKVNYSESVAFAELVREAGFDPLEVTGGSLPHIAGPGQPLVFINSCTVTAEAERKALQYVRRIKREHPAANVLLTGCAARNHSSRQRFSAAGARVFEFYPAAFEWIQSSSPAGETSEEFPTGVTAVSRARAFVKVQDGCHNMCSFCVIPFVRPYASRPFSEVLDEVDRRVADGIRELVLTGVNIGHYGMTPVDTKEAIASDKYWQRSKIYRKVDGHPSLFDLIDAILARLPEGHRLRISSIEPEDIDERFYEQLAHPRMCPHLHLPLQSGSDTVLAEMRRLYDSGAYLRIAAAFRRACPHGALTTDILVGYPAETDEDFAATLAVCDEAQFERIHGFPFSPRQGTRAAMLKQLPRETVLARNRRLIAHCDEIALARWRRFVGATAQLLLEECEDGVYSGHGEAYQQIVLPEQPGMPAPGSICDVSLDAYADGVFSASLLDFRVVSCAAGSATKQSPCPVQQTPE